jgi:hypothetical protein
MIAAIDFELVVSSASSVAFDTCSGAVRLEKSTSFVSSNICTCGKKSFFFSLDLDNIVLTNKSYSKPCGHKNTHHDDTNEDL